MLKNAIKMALLFPNEVIALYPYMYMSVYLCVCVYMCIYAPTRVHACIHTHPQGCMCTYMDALDVYRNLENA